MSELVDEVMRRAPATEEAIAATREGREVW